MSNKNKNFIIWGELPPSIGGGSAQEYRILKALGDRGYAVSAFVQKPSHTIHTASDCLVWHNYESVI